MEKSTSPVFGIITAVPNEAIYILTQMQNKQEKTIGIYQYTLGFIENRQIVLLIGGVGTTNAAIASSNMIHHFNPTYLIFSGTAGGANKDLNVGDVVISKKIYDFDVGNPNEIAPSWFDFPINPARKQADPVIYYAAEKLLDASQNLSKPFTQHAYTHVGEKVAAKIMAGALATTQHMPNNNWDVLRMHALQVDTADMETAAFMKACWLYQKSCIVFRGISNIIAPFTKETIYTVWNKENEQLASDNAGVVTVHFIQTF